MPRYIWKTVHLPGEYDPETYAFPSTVIARSEFDEIPPDPYLFWWSPAAPLKVTEGWRLGRWRKCKGKPSLCRRGFHGNRQPHHAIGWNYGNGLALLEVAGRSDRKTDPYYTDRESVKECYAEARIVALWDLTKVRFRRHGMRGYDSYEWSQTLPTLPPLHGAWPKGYKLPTRKQVRYRSQLPAAK